MRTDELRRIVEELRWHCDDPKKAAAVLTDEEAADILKRGYVTKDLWKAIQPRLASTEG